MNINKIDNNNFKGKLILREKMFPRKNSKVVPSELKELVETFEKRTANQPGTMFVQKITKAFEQSDTFQMNTYFKNDDYIDALVVDDQHLFESLISSERSFSINEAIDKLVNIFNRYKEREQVVKDDIIPLERQIELLQQKLNLKKEQINSKGFEYNIVASAQQHINGENILDNGLNYNYFKDIDDCLDLQNKIILEA